MQIRGFDFTSRFSRELKGAAPDVQHAAQEALRLLQQNHRTVRAHALHGHKPKLYVLDVYSNHSWQITFELLDGVAILRRLARHKDIDRAPK